MVKLSAIGDVVHTLPALNALRRYYPDAHITWLVEEAAADLVVGHPALDRVLISKRKRWLSGLRTSRRRSNFNQLKRFLSELRDTRYDLLFDFQAAIKGAALIALARAQRKIGLGMDYSTRNIAILRSMSEFLQSAWISTHLNAV